MFWYYLTHLDISMVVIFIIGIIGNRLEPGPVPKMMSWVGYIYIILTLIRFIILDVTHTIADELTDEEAPESEMEGCYFYDLKEDERGRD